MSEHYDFHYQPTGSGAISGQQVLEQTEDAINELGDYVNDNVGGAMDVAQQALETAQNAEQDAQTALDTANSFSDAIQSAQQDASTALSTAQTAQTTASNANNTAIQAQQDASSAVTTANNASGQVSTLSGTVTALGQRVTTAEGNIGQNTSDITTLGQRVNTAEGNITTLQNDVSIAQGNASSAMATAGQVKQQAFVFRYSSTALVASSTNSNTLLDNTDNLKVGDKVIDSSGVLFSVTAIDTQNSTFTIGTALIDLAQDSDVVHKSGNETVTGTKTFTSTITGNLTGTASKATSDANGREIATGYMWRGSYERIIGTSEEHKDLNTYQDAGFYNVKTALVDNCPSGIGVDAVLLVYPWDHGKNYSTQEITEAAASSNARRWVRKCNNGTWSDWKRIAFTTDDISGNASTATEFSANKDVTLTGDVTGTASSKAGWSVATTLANSGVTAGTYGPSADVTGSNNTTILVPEITVDAKGRVTAVTNRTYTSVNTDNDKKVYQYYKSDDDVYRLLFSNNAGNTATSNVGVMYSGLNNSFYVNPSTGALYAYIYNSIGRYFGNEANSNQRTNITLYANSDTQNQSCAYITRFRSNRSQGGLQTGDLQKIGFDVLENEVRTNNVFDIQCTDWLNNAPQRVNFVSSAQSYSWGRSTNKSLFNDLNPGALSLPDIDKRIDISSYITDLSDGGNAYTPTVNGWISIRSANANKISILDSVTSIGNTTISNTATYLTVIVPVIANRKVILNVMCTSLEHAYFIPCQGNV